MFAYLIAEWQYVFTIMYIGCELAWRLGWRHAGRRALPWL